MLARLRERAVALRKSARACFGPIRSQASKPARRPPTPVASKVTPPPPSPPPKPAPRPPVSKASDAHAAVNRDLKSLIEQTGYTNADERLRGIFNRVREIEEKTKPSLRARWVPREQELRDTLLPKAVAASGSVRQLNVKTRTGEQVRRRLMAAFDGLEDGLRDMTQALPTRDAELFNRGTAAFGKAINDYIAIKKYVKGIITGGDKEALDARAASTAGDLRQQASAYINSTRITDARKALQLVAQRLVAMENSDHNRNKTLRRTWGPHLGEIEKALLPKIQSAVQAMRAARPEHADLLKMHQDYLTGMELMEAALRDWVRAIREDDGSLFKAGEQRLRQMKTKIDSGTKREQAIAARLSKG